MGDKSVAKKMEDRDVQASVIIYTGSFRFPVGDAAAARVLGIGKALRELGYEVVFGGGESKGRAEDLVEPAGYSYQGFHYTPQGAIASGGSGPLRRIAELATASRDTLRWIDGHRPQGIAAIIGYGPVTPLLLRLRSYTRSHGIPLILDVAEWPSAHNLPGGPLGARRLDSEFRMRWLNRECGNIIAISSYLATYYERSGCRVVRVPPLVDLEEEKWKTAARSEHAGLRLIYAGSPGNKDLLGNMMRGVLMMRDASCKMELHVVGVTEEQASRLLGGTLTEAQKSRASVICHGRIPQSDVPGMLAGADFSVLLRPDRRYAHAGFATKVVESLSAGTPVIVNATSDIAEYVKDGLEGLLVQGDSAEALAATLRIAAELSQAKLEEMRILAKMRARESFDFRSYGAELQEFLDGAVRGARLA